MSPATTAALTPANDMPSPPGLLMSMSPKRIAAGEFKMATAAPDVFETVVLPVTVKLPAMLSSTTPDTPPSWLIELSVT